MLYFRLYTIARIRHRTSDPLRHPQNIVLAATISRAHISLDRQCCEQMIEYVQQQRVPYNRAYAFSRRWPTTTRILDTENSEVARQNVRYVDVSELLLGLEQERDYMCWRLCFRPEIQ